jgi:23S rRNA pseudouridine1911/1915/1917 synthase
MSGVRRLIVTPAEAGRRVDVALTLLFPDLTRTRAQRLIAEGGATVDGAQVKPRRLVHEGEVLEFTLPEGPTATVDAEDIPLTVIYEDEHLAVIDKPAGMVVHPAPGHPGGTLVNALLARYGTLSPIGAPARPGIVHRLDRDTSGLIVIARTEQAHHALAAAIASKNASRRYLALAAGVPDPRSGEVDLAIGRDHRDRKRISAATNRPREAVTRYTTVEAFGTVASLLEASLTTGRTHQIRVHLAAIGHAVIGDQTYGKRRWKSCVPSAGEALAARQMLHAHRLEFTHPVTGERLSFTAAPPADFEALLGIYRRKYGPA